MPDTRVYLSVLSSPETSYKIELDDRRSLIPGPRETQPPPHRSKHIVSDAPVVAQGDEGSPFGLQRVFENTSRSHHGFGVDGFDISIGASANGCELMPVAMNQIIVKVLVAIFIPLTRFFKMMNSRTEYDSPRLSFLGVHSCVARQAQHTNQH